MLGRLVVAARGFSAAEETADAWLAVGAVAIRAAEFCANGAVPDWGRTTDRRLPATAVPALPSTLLAGFRAWVARLFVFGSGLDADVALGLTAIDEPASAGLEPDVAAVSSAAAIPGAAVTATPRPAANAPARSHRTIGHDAG